MDLDKAALVICLTLFIVIGVNAALYVSLRSRGTIGQIDLFRKAAQRARRPWGKEEDALVELSQRVAALKKASSPANQQATDASEPSHEE